LLELAIVVVVIAVVAATAAPRLAGYIETRRLEGAATRLAADIHWSAARHWLATPRCA
jgi:Tfp pilus assembly protein FimT